MVVRQPCSGAGAVAAVHGRLVGAEHARAAPRRRAHRRRRATRPARSGGCRAGGGRARRRRAARATKTARSTTPCTRVATATPISTRAIAWSRERRRRDGTGRREQCRRRERVVENLGHDEPREEDERAGERERRREQRVALGHEPRVYAYTGHAASDMTSAWTAFRTRSPSRGCRSRAGRRRTPGRARCSRRPTSRRAAATVLPEAERAHGVDRLVRHDPEPGDAPAREPVEQRRDGDERRQRDGRSYSGASKSASQRVRSGSIGSSCSSFAFSSSSVALSRVVLTRGHERPKRAALEAVDPVHRMLTAVELEDGGEELLAEPLRGELRRECVRCPDEILELRVVHDDPVVAVVVGLPLDRRA